MQKVKYSLILFSFLIKRQNYKTTACIVHRPEKNRSERSDPKKINITTKQTSEEEKQNYLNRCAFFFFFNHLAFAG